MRILPITTRLNAIPNNRQNRPNVLTNSTAGKDKYRAKNPAFGQKPEKIDIKFISSRGYTEKVTVATENNRRTTAIETYRHAERQDSTNETILKNPTKIKTTHEKIVNNLFGLRKKYMTEKVSVIEKSPGVKKEIVTNYNKAGKIADVTVKTTKFNSTNKPISLLTQTTFYLSDGHKNQTISELNVPAAKKTVIQHISYEYGRFPSRQETVVRAKIEEYFSKPDIGNVTEQTVTYSESYKDVARKILSLKSSLEIEPIL